MRIIFLIIYLSTIGLGLAQTAEHIQVSGTKCSMIPPENFVPASGFSGFQNNKNGASIMINELPGSYTQISDGFTAEALKTKGMHLISREIVDFNQAKATYLNVSQAAGGRKYFKQILVFGDDDKTILVNGIYPEEIKASLFSTVYNAAQNDDPFAAAKFTIDVSGSSFTFAKYMSGSFLYTENGQFSTGKAMLIVSNSIGKVVIQDRKQYAIARLKKLPNGGQNKVQKIEPVTIDGMNGYEITAQGKNDNSEDELVYQVMLFPNDSEYFMLVGLTPTVKENNLAVFKKIAQTFKRK